MRIATRGSALARWQAEHVASLLGGDTELVVVETQADRRLDIPIWELGGKGAFAKEVQAAVLEGRADLAVHSAKDLPSVTVDGLILAAVPERGDARDALVGGRLDDLPAGACIATGSIRRRVQLANLRPDLTFTSLRGNMQTRRAKVGTNGIDAVVVAAVAFERLAYGDDIAEVLPVSRMLPQVGQGALAIECRVGDDATRSRLAGIEHTPSRIRLDAERAFLAELGGDCDLPAGAYATMDGGVLVVDALLASLDGHILLRHHLEGTTADPVAVGRDAARYLLENAGGGALTEWLAS